MQDLRAAAVQFESVQADKRANLGRIAEFAARAAERGVRLLVFPECCITGYWFLRKLSREAIAELAEPVFSGPSSAALAELSARHGMTIGAGLVEAGEDGRFYNTYVVAMPDGAFARLNYRVVDYEKAKRSLRGDVKLLPDGADRPLPVMSTGRLGPLVQRPSSTGRPQFMMFMNPGHLLQKGGRATLKIGQSRIPGIPVA